jgi:sugar phosphate isomerase/epimerase
VGREQAGMSFITLGIVSNVWSALLEEHSIESLCSEARARGYGYVELRQRAIGSAERAPAPGQAPVPLPPRLGELARSLPELSFNLAIEVPFLTPVEEVDEGTFVAGLEAARSLGGDPPFLRLVDVTPTQTVLEPAAFAACVGRVRELALRATGSGGAPGVRLALENSRQPLSTLLQLLDIVAAELGGRALPPLLCWDAANMLGAITPEDPQRVVSRLRAGQLALFHFKQLKDGQLQPDVGDGEIDWRFLLAQLQEKGYRGPALFEIPPGPDAWSRLDRSRAYIQGILGDLRPEP